MTFSCSMQWSAWAWILVVGLLQTYTIYTSINRYILLKSEVDNSFVPSHEDQTWIVTLLNCQLLVVILALGILPLWFYSIIFSSSSILCGSQQNLNRRGFYHLVWDEAVNVFDRHIHRECSSSNHKRSKCCCGEIKLAIFFPVSNLLHVSIAYLLNLPIPFVEAWLIVTNDGRKETLTSNDLQFLGSSDLIVKVKYSVEYFNFFLSLFLLSFQFSKLLWACNKPFSICLNIIQVLVTIQIAFNFSIFSIFIKYYYNHLLPSNPLFNPYFVLLITTIADSFLLFTSFSYFQFGFEKCVQYLLRSPWFNFINRNGITRSTGHGPIATDSSSTWSLEHAIYTTNSLCPTMSAAVLFILGMGITSFTAYEYWLYLRSSPYLMGYLVQSLVLIIVYFMVWFGMCLKPDWIFKVTEKDVTQSFVESWPDKYQSNERKHARESQSSDKMLFSTVSSNYSTLPTNRKETISISDFSKLHEYESRCSSLKVHPSNKQISKSSEHLCSKNHNNIPNDFRSVYAGNTVPLITSPTINNSLCKDFVRCSTPTYYKCAASSCSILRMNELARSQEVNRPKEVNYTIEEEVDVDTESSSGEVLFLDVHPEVTSSQNPFLKNNSQLKFVTFQLDKNAEISADLCSSNDSLTMISVEVADTSRLAPPVVSDEGNASTTFKNESVHSLFMMDPSASDGVKIVSMDIEL